MKIIKRYFEKDRSGYVRLQADDLEDIWHLYNLILVGDKVQAGTERRVQNDTLTGTTSSERIKMTLTIKVESIDPDLQRGTLRISGQTVEENKWVKLNSYHTLDIELFKPFAIHKEEWDSMCLERIQSLTNVQSKADLGAIVLQEGLANVCLMSDCLTIVVQRIEVTIPKKRKGSTSQQEKAMARFHDQIYQALVQHFDMSKLKCVILASPGFVKENFYEYMCNLALKEERKDILAAKGAGKFVLVHCSSGHKMALNEALKDPSVANRLSDSKYSSELKVMNAFFDMLSNDPDRAFYGLEHVKKALDMGAISKLLVTDALFRSPEVSVRKMYIRMVEQARKQGAEVFIFSTSHVTGEQLQQFTGIAAILSFPLPDLDS